MGLFLDRTCGMIYDCFPRKVGRRAALVAIERAIQRLQGEGHTEISACQWLLMRVRTFARSPKAKGEYCPMPATFMNQGRYHDDPSEWQRGNGHAPAESADVQLNMEDDRNRLEAERSQFERERRERDDSLAKLTPDDLDRLAWAAKSRNTWLAPHAATSPALRAGMVKLLNEGWTE